MSAAPVAVRADSLDPSTEASPAPDVLTPDTLAAALDAGALQVHFQPVVALPSRAVIAFEALARLRLDDGRLLSPAAFIPTAESSGLVVRLGELVLREAVAAAARWRREVTALATATVSVNVAASQLDDPGFLPFVRTLLRRHAVPGHALLLELTESLASSPRVRPVLEELSALGIRVALDDFGVGFATLDNVRRLPIKVLKLDRSFVAGVTAAGADRAIARVVVDLADTLGLSVIAEGVETSEQADALVRLGCGAVQGFLFGAASPDPEKAAARVHFSRHHDQDAGHGWSVDGDTAVLAAARLLSSGYDAVQRATLHAVAVALAVAAGLTPDGVESVRRLALVHDVARLSLDGALPKALLDAPRLVDLLDVAASPCPEVAVIRVAREVAVRAVVTDRRAQGSNGVVDRAGPGRADLAAICQAVAALLPPQDRSLAAALSAVALCPPEVRPLGEVIDDLDRRRLGRRGMEQRVTSLVGISRVLADERDSRELLRQALDEARRIVGAASASLERWERDACRLRTLVNVGQLGPGEVSFPEDETYDMCEHLQARLTLLDGLPVVHMVDDPDSPPEARAVLRRLGKYSSAAVPVHLEGRSWGQLWFTTAPGEPPFAAADIETLTSVAVLMSGVAVQADSLDRMSRLDHEDPLTGLANRRSIDEVLAGWAGSGLTTACALLDVEALQTINGRDGYAAGDRVLVLVADALSRAVAERAHARVGRLGGDEFCVVVAGTDEDRLRTVVENALADLRVRDATLTVSAGFAESGPPGWTPFGLLASATVALHEAKLARAPR